MAGHVTLTPAPFDPWGALNQVSEGWWLVARCRRHTRHYPRRLMILQHGSRMTVRELLARWRCKRCGERPKAEAWMDDPARGSVGHPGEPALRVEMGD